MAKKRTTPAPVPERERLYAVVAVCHLPDGSRASRMGPLEYDVPRAWRACLFPKSTIDEPPNPTALAERMAKAARLGWQVMAFDVSASSIHAV